MMRETTSYVQLQDPWSRARVTSQQQLTQKLLRPPHPVLDHIVLLCDYQWIQIHGCSTQLNVKRNTHIVNTIRHIWGHSTQLHFNTFDYNEIHLHTIDYNGIQWNWTYYNWKRIHTIERNAMGFTWTTADRTTEGEGAGDAWTAFIAVSSSMNGSWTSRTFILQLILQPDFWMYSRAAP